MASMQDESRSAKSHYFLGAALLIFATLNVQVQQTGKGYCCMGKSYTHLNLEERCLLQTQFEMGLSPAAIAVGLKRARSTVFREFRLSRERRCTRCCSLTCRPATNDSSRSSGSSWIRG